MMSSNAKLLDDKESAVDDDVWFMNLVNGFVLKEIKEERTGESMESLEDDRTPQARAEPATPATALKSSDDEFFVKVYDQIKEMKEELWQANVNKTIKEMEDDLWLANANNQIKEMKDELWSGKVGDQREEHKGQVWFNRLEELMADVEQV